ncbi:MAG: hypothetical protein ACQESE_04735 [Nanobdellota archaeon]
MASDTSSRIVELLKGNTHDMTISEIATTLGIERHTAAKHLDALHAKGLCDYRTVGRSKLWKLADSPLLSLFSDTDSPVSKELASMLSDIGDRIVIQDEDLKVIWSNYNDALNKKCFEAFTRRKTSCPDCPVRETFESGNGKKGIGHGGTVKTTPLKKDGKTVAVINITCKK